VNFDSTALLQVQHEESESGLFLGLEKTHADEDMGVGCPQVPDVTCHKRHGHRVSGPNQAMRRMFARMPAKPISPAGGCGMCAGGTGGILYSVERYDGLGQRAAHLLISIATAQKMGMRFGGLLPNPIRSVHGEDMKRCLSALIGADYGQILRHVRHAEFNTCFYHDRDPYMRVRRSHHLLTEEGMEDGRSYNVLYHECSFGRDHVSYLTPSFLGSLRQHTRLLTMPSPGFAKVKQCHIAVHVRRGDIRSATNPGQRERDKSDSVYLKVIGQVRNMVPSSTCDVHVFSTTKEGKYSSKDFNVYRSKNIHVHLDNDELSDWPHMAQATVLIQAPSGFSWVAGVVNPKCVVAFRSYIGRLPFWASHNDGVFSAGEKRKLRKCIFRHFKPQRTGRAHKRRRR